MDYKFLVSAHQDAAGSENAKIKIEVEGAVAVASAEITSSDADNPTDIVFEVTGLDATSSSTTIDVKYTLLNDYYVDSSTDRNAIIHQMAYHDKTNGTAYQRNEINAGVNSFVTTTDFNFSTMDPAEMTAINPAPPGDFTLGYHVILSDDTPYTVTYKLPLAANRTDISI
tara:strand:+ start:68 stop:577 length:510 start_codon:yes stop_codon:yes gene_type:complete